MNAVVQPRRRNAGISSSSALLSWPLPRGGCHDLFRLHRHVATAARDGDAHGVMIARAGRFRRGRRDRRRGIRVHGRGECGGAAFGHGGSLDALDDGIKRVRSWDAAPPPERDRRHCPPEHRPPDPRIARCRCRRPMDRRHRRRYRQHLPAHRPAACLPQSVAVRGRLSPRHQPRRCRRRRRYRRRGSRAASRRSPRRGLRP